MSTKSTNPQIATSECLTPDELVSKDYPQKILSLSFEYLLIGLCREYSRLSNIPSLNEFNKRNKIGWDYILSNPFFVAISNGNSKSLFELLGDFYTFSLGFTSFRIYDLINPDNTTDTPTQFEHLKITPERNPVSVKIINSETNEGFDKIQDKIRQKQILFHGNNVEFGNICVINDLGKPGPIYEAIDSAIKVIKVQAESILIGDNETMLYKASFYPTFRRFKREGKLLQIKYDEIKGTEKPFPTEGPRSRPKPDEPETPPKPASAHRRLTPTY